MKTSTRLLSIALVAFATVTGCGGSGGDGGGAVTPPPPPAAPPPAADQSPSGVWDGQAVTQGSPDVSTSFEFSDTGPFSVGTSPFTASFSNGNAETRGVLAFYITGLNAWHILTGTAATVTFETLPRTLSFWVRTVNAADVSDIQILDQNSTLIMAVVPTNAYQQIVVNRAAGETSIESMVVTSTSGGDVVIDDFTIGFPSTTDTTDDISCLVAETMELVCTVSDVATGAFVAGIQGTVQVNGSAVTGTGTIHAAPGTTLVDGSTVADVTISAGTADEGNTLDLTVDAAGVTVAVSTTYDAAYDRGSDLATVAGVYMSFDLFGDLTSFSVDADGVITSGSAAGCVSNGQISIIDADFNAYDVTLDVAMCGALDGMYDGLGLTQDENATDDVFTFGVFTNQSVIVGDPTR
ncbi:MAG: hypothetical protein O6763_05145 [Gammaproteobacteria bacterium]|nr:hypothetical protein [Gammaproteobacteria bacterium]